MREGVFSAKKSEICLTSMKTSVILHIEHRGQTGDAMVTCRHLFFVRSVQIRGGVIPKRRKHGFRESSI